MESLCPSQVTHLGGSEHCKVDRAGNRLQALPGRMQMIPAVVGRPQPGGTIRVTRCRVGIEHLSTPRRDRVSVYPPHQPHRTNRRGREGMTSYAARRIATRLETRLLRWRAGVP